MKLEALKRKKKKENYVKVCFENMKDVTIKTWVLIKNIANHKRFCNIIKAFSR